MSAGLHIPGMTDPLPGMLLMAVGAEHQVDFGKVAQKRGERSDRTVKSVVPGEHHYVGTDGAHLRHQRGQRGVCATKPESVFRQNPLRHLRLGHADDRTAHAVSLEKLPCSRRGLDPVRREHRAAKRTHQPEQGVAAEFVVVVAGDPDVVTVEIEHGDHRLPAAVARDRTALHRVAAVDAQRLLPAGTEGVTELRHRFEPPVQIGCAEDFQLRAGEQKHHERGGEDREIFHNLSK